MGKSERDHLTEDATDTMDHLFSGEINSRDLDMSVGAPGPDILCKLPEMFLRATARRMEIEAESGSLFQYGPEQGIVSFRRNLARLLADEYKSPVDEDELIVTTGATNGLFLTCSLLLDSQAVVFVENPTYFIALKILSQDLGFKVIPIPMNKDGIDTKTLEKCVKEARRKYTGSEDKFWSMLYTIPNFHNPTGISFSDSVCGEMVRISAENGMLVFCDDVYNLLTYQDKPHASRLKSLDKNNFVISNGTFSKILAPGLRLGWLEVPKCLVSRFTSSGMLVSGGSQNNYTSGIVSTLLQQGEVATHLEDLRLIYGERMHAAYKYLSENLPGSWTLVNPGGGFFLWIEADCDLTEFCSRLAEAGVNVLQGTRACPYTFIGESHEGNLSNAFRLSIAYFTLDKIVEACKVICEQANKKTIDK